jgi:hypothetical protein
MSGDETFICSKNIWVINRLLKMAEFLCKIVHSSVVHEHCTLRNQVTFANGVICDCKGMAVHEFIAKC